MAEFALRTWGYSIWYYLYIRLVFYVMCKCMFEYVMYEYSYWIIRTKHIITVKHTWTNRVEMRADGRQLKKGNQLS